MATQDVVSFGWNKTKNEATSQSKVSGRIYFTKETDGSTAIYVDGVRYALGSSVLDTIITWYNSTIGVGDTAGVIDQWDEIVKFLEGISDSDAETLAQKLVAINTEITNIKNGTTTVTNATNATNATNLASKPVIAKGTTSTNAITVTAGGKTSDEFTVPYATKAGSADSSHTARELDSAPSLIADGDAIKVRAGGKDSIAFTVPFATKATTLTDKPTVAQADQGRNVTITVGGKTSDAFTIGYASTANSATKATQDGAGNNIVNTYATKANLGTLTEGYEALMDALTWQ